jgi:hypothetical protein
LKWKVPRERSSLPPFADLHHSQPTSLWPRVTHFPESLPLRVTNMRISRPASSLCHGWKDEGLWVPVYSRNRWQITLHKLRSIRLKNSSCAVNELKSAITSPERHSNRTKRKSWKYSGFVGIWSEMQ